MFRTLGFRGLGFRGQGLPSSAPTFPEVRETNRQKLIWEVLRNPRDPSAHDHKLSQSSIITLTPNPKYKYQMPAYLDP